MFNRTAIKNGLALDRRTFTELAAGFSAVAVAGATLYNLGFFAPLEWSLISLLTVQDLLTGAAIAAAPMAACGWLAVMLGRLIKLAPSRVPAALAAGIPALGITGFGFYYFYSGPGQWTLGHLACGYLALGVIAAGINILIGYRHLPALWLVFSLVYIPTVLGMSNSVTATGPGRPVSEIVTDKEVIQGRVVRVTSAFLLIARDNTVITMPMSKVREIRRIFLSSPEDDFLTGSLSIGTDSAASDAVASDPGN
jgi:hypothetical protein